MENLSTKAAFTVLSAEHYQDKKYEIIVQKNLPDNRELLKITLSLQAEGQESFPFHRSNFSLLLPSGEQIDESSLAELPEFSEHMILSSALTKGNVLKGALFFEVPKGIEYTRLRLQYESFTAEKQSKLYTIPLL